VRGLEKLVSERQLVNSDKISMLKGSRLGIDAHHWLRTRIQKVLADQEPLVTAMGGMPLGLETAIEKELEGFKEAGISPFFVFNGLTVKRDPGSSARPFISSDKRPSQRADGWAAYIAGNHDTAAALWSGAGMISSSLFFLLEN